MNRNNNNDKTRLNRREMLKLGAAASAVGLLGVPLGSAEAKTEDEQPKPLGGPGYVVRVHKPGMRGRFFPHPDAAREMVEKAVTRLAGEDNLKKAWSRFVKAEDRVGIKINALAGRFAGTMKEVVEPIVEGVRAAGVPDENIMIFDQYGGYMRAARFEWQEKPSKLRVINHGVLGYEKAITESDGGGRGRLAKTLTWATARPMSTLTRKCVLADGLRRWYDLGMGTPQCTATASEQPGPVPAKGCGQPEG